MQKETALERERWPVRAQLSESGWAGAGTGATGDAGSVPGSRRSPGEGNGNPLWDFCLGNLMGRGAWWALVHEARKNPTWRSTPTWRADTSVAALQSRVRFCCRAKGTSHTCTSRPSHLDSFPCSWPQRTEFPELCSGFSLVICFIRNITIPPQIFIVFQNCIMALMNLSPSPLSSCQCLCLAPTYELALQTGRVVERMGKFCVDVQVMYAIRGNRSMYQLACPGWYIPIYI